MLESLGGALRDLARAAGHEDRHVFSRVRLDPAGGFRVESSDAGLLADAVPRLRDLAAGVAVDPRLLPQDDLGGSAAWVAASVAEVRREPAHTAEQVTQALQGEVLEPLLHEEGWVLGRLADGYVGWIRDWHLQLVPRADPERFAPRCDARIDATCIALRAAPGDDRDACGETILGTRVAVLGSERGWSQVELPGGRRGWLPQASLRAGTGPWPARVPSLLVTLRRFLGVPYSWGGRSPKGFDCSGLVQFAFGLHGVPLPRDADEQSRCGDGVEAPVAGDLLVFGKTRITHIAVALGADEFLHARGEVRCNRLVPGSARYDAELRDLWRGTRRVTLPAVST